MIVTLIVETGPHKGREIPLIKQQTVLGKSSQSDIRVPSQVVSRHHCCISIKKDSVVLRDLFSKNGTFVNDKKISEETVLKSGDKIKLGQTVFAVRIAALPGDAAQAEASPAAKSGDAEPDGMVIEEVVEEIVIVEAESDGEEEIPVAQILEDEPGAAYATQTAPAEETRTTRPVDVDSKAQAEPFTAYDADFYLRIAECLVAAREEFFEHYRDSSRRTRNILALLVKALGLSESEAKMLDLAGLLYDVGKMLLPKTILDKRGPLTPDEKKIMHRHPRAAVSFFGAAGLPDEMEQAILAHHERFDGTGYPKQLQGDAIPKAARVLAFADSLSAMTSSRPYRISMSTSQAIDEIERCAGTHFDPRMVAGIVGYCRLGQSELRRAISVRH